MAIAEALFLTLALELPFFAFTRRRDIGALLFVLAMNAVTNLGFNLLYTEVFAFDPAFLWAGEIGVALIEGSLLYRFDRRNPWGFLIALAANLVSLGIGLLVNHLIGQGYLSVLAMLIAAVSIFVLEMILFPLAIVGAKRPRRARALRA